MCLLCHTRVEVIGLGRDSGFYPLGLGPPDMTQDQEQPGPPNGSDDTDEIRVGYVVRYQVKRAFYSDPLEVHTGVVIYIAPSIGMYEIAPLNPDGTLSSKVRAVHRTRIVGVDALESLGNVDRDFLAEWTAARMKLLKDD